MAYWLVDSPGSGDGGRDAEFWLGYLREQGVEDVIACLLEDADQWTRLVSSEDYLLAAGGDGTVNGVALLCLRTGATLAVLPSGTANDFARNLGIPSDPAEVARLVAEGVVEMIDVAEFDDRIYLNVAHIGLGTLPSRKASSPTKKLFGRFSYVATLFRQLGAQRGFHARIQTDSSVVQGRWLSIAVATGAYFGGGHEIPEASANDGLLDVIAVKPRPLPQLLLAFLMVKLNGKTPRRTSTVIQMKGCWCQVETSRPKTVTVDGDVAGKTPFRATCRPRVIRVIGRHVVHTGEDGV
ncbi:diacylglycerol/lipid kinase family protein [Marinobacter daepoensis]|uniref:diacylglycerol/lipid kinase family protein n=1 Tax=Marinobacter daepoensis TaxID=262077 RepID=UPI000403C6FD|nr:diacylglycerol kinase family protein [Marinobacter daepoensis]